MLMLRRSVLVAVAFAGFASVSHGQIKYGFGTPATDADVAAWNLDIDAAGKSLPAGQGSVKAGKELYDAQCASCHGATGEGGIGDRLVGGQGTLATPRPVKTIGSFWPYAPTLFDYVRRAMPLNAQQSLTNDEVYAISAYLLHLNGLLKDDATLNAKSLAAVKMPNRNGFVEDPRPDVKP